jgi:hypothetical protein
VDGDRIIAAIERGFIASVRLLLSFVVKFYRRPRSLLGSIVYETKHLAVLATIAWFLNKIFATHAVVVWIAGSIFMDWVLKKYGPVVTAGPRAPSVAKSSSA